MPKTTQSLALPSYKPTGEVRPWIQAKWDKSDKTDITPDRCKGLSVAANASWTECEDAKKYYQPYMPGKACIPPKEKKRFEKQARVHNCSERMWRLFGPNMAQKG